jgi:hypothetical protein
MTADFIYCLAILHRSGASTGMRNTRHSVAASGTLGLNHLYAGATIDL